MENNIEKNTERVRKIYEYICHHLHVIARAQFEWVWNRAFISLAIGIAFFYSIAVPFLYFLWFVMWCNAIDAIISRPHQCVSNSCRE